MAKQEQHLTTARLSAFIDGQLSSAEQAQTEAHLHTCVVCQQQLAELRQIVALLHALPPPKLPRSFTLPIAEPVATPRVSNTARPLAPITPLPRRNTWPTYAANVVRYASTLAAVLGIVFLLSGVFGTVLSAGGETASSGGSSTTSSVGPEKTTLPQVVTPRISQGDAPTETPTKSPSSASSHNIGGPTSVQQNPFQALLTLFSLNMIGTREIIGVVLVVLGIIGFLIARRL